MAPIARTEHVPAETRPKLEDGWSRDTPPQDTILRQFLYNQAELNAAIALAMGGRAVDVSGAFIADAGSQVPYMNQALLTRPAQRSDDPVYSDVESFFDTRGGPATLLSLWPTADLWHRGWILYGHPVLVVKPPVLAGNDLPDGVSVEVVNDLGSLLEAERILIEGFPIGDPDEIHDQPDPSTVLGPGVLDTNLTVRLGLVDGEPVATGCSYVSHGVVNLAMAATRPAARRRGVWQALVRARMDDGPGMPAVAYTSDLSRPGFLTMGFLPIMRLTLWGRG